MIRLPLEEALEQGFKELKIAFGAREYTGDKELALESERVMTGDPSLQAAIDARGDALSRESGVIFERQVLYNPLKVSYVVRSLKEKIDRYALDKVIASGKKALEERITMWLEHPKINAGRKLGLFGMELFKGIGVIDILDISTRAGHLSRIKPKQKEKLQQQYTEIRALSGKSYDQQHPEQVAEAILDLYRGNRFTALLSSM